jgi:multiple sugar transport system substrate-binding protein
MRKILMFLFLTLVGISYLCAEKTKLVIWSYWEGEAQSATLTGLCKSFNDSQSNIEASWEYIPFADIKKQLSIGVAAKKLPDMVIIDNPDHAAFSAMGIFADITDKVKNWKDKDQYFPGPIKSTILNGKNYGLPFGSNCIALFYNTEMLDKAGVKPPKTWDELKASAKKLTKDNVIGFAISAAKGEEGTFQFLPWLLSAGANVEKIDSPEAIKAYSFLLGLVNDGSMSKEVINWTQGDCEKQFAAGKIAMMINGPWNIANIKLDAPSLKYGIALFPKDKVDASVLGGENMAIIKGKNEDASWKFLQFVADPARMKDTCLKMGYFPPRKDVAKDKVWTDDPLYKVFMEEMQYAMPRGPHPKWPLISIAISDALQEVLTGTNSPEKSVKTAQQKITKALSGK